MKKLGKKTTSMENVEAYINIIESCICKCICMPEPGMRASESATQNNLVYYTVFWE